MKLYFSLNQALECGKVCHYLTKTIHEHLEINGTLENAVLIMEIKDSVEHQTLPKLEHNHDIETP